ncbi:hypothetical protein IQ22_03316 [Pseudomonas duriflava]|uniref:Uncharacterized protein n=1 Tax=Pseudomonas duriflava TaxID=459528 RepID=A0A562Q941_9PSED|nr:hypothetical protein IQ22_03316 [Pseudomonas duriflava]
MKVLLGIYSYRDSKTGSLLDVLPLNTWRSITNHNLIVIYMPKGTKQRKLGRKPNRTLAVCKSEVTFA